MKFLWFQQTPRRFVVQMLVTCSLLVPASASKSKVPGLDVSVKACCASLPVFGSRFFNPETFLPSASEHQMFTGQLKNPSCSLLEMFPVPLVDNQICKNGGEEGLSLQDVLQVKDVIASSVLLQAGRSLLGVFVEQGECKDISSKPRPDDANVDAHTPEGLWPDHAYVDAHTARGLETHSQIAWEYGHSELHSGFWTPGGSLASVTADPSVVVKWKCGADGSGFALSATWKDMAEQDEKKQSDYGGHAERVSSGEGGDGAPAWECYNIMPPTTIKHEWKMKMTKEEELSRLVQKSRQMSANRALVYFYGEPACVEKVDKSPETLVNADTAGNSLSLAGKLGIALLVVTILAGVLFFAWARTRKRPRQRTSGLACGLAQQREVQLSPPRNSTSPPVCRY